MLTRDDIDGELPHLCYLRLANCGAKEHVEAIAADLRTKCARLVKEQCHVISATSREWH